MEKKFYELTVDPELEKVAPPLAEHEFEILKAGIMEVGCKFPLIVWNGVIVDGHNRYKICRENGIPFAIEEMPFENKTEAKMWIIRNQIGRRNLCDYQCCEMVYPLEKEIKAEAERRQKAGVPILAQGSKTRDIMANMAGVSHGTWDKAKVIIEEADEEDKEKLRIGKAKIHSVYTKLRKKDKDPEEQQEEPEDKDPEDQREEQEHKDLEDQQTTFTRMDEPMEFPDMRDAPERTPRPFEYVRDQAHFAIENMIKELKIGLNWLRDEDTGKVDELITMLNDGYSRAATMIEEAKNE